MLTKESERLVYTVEEVAKVLGICRCTAYSLAKQGRLGAIRISDRRYIVPKAVVSRLLGGVDIPS